MAMEYKNVRTTDISRREGLLSALDDLAPLPAPDVPPAGPNTTKQG